MILAIPILRVRIPPLPLKNGDWLGVRHWRIKTPAEYRPATCLSPFFNTLC
jgi:hypothetical protein